MGVPFAEMSDEELMNRVRDCDDHEAFKELYRRYHEDLVRRLRGRAGLSQGWAEELAQEAWLRIWRFRDRWNRGGFSAQ